MIYLFDDGSVESKLLQHEHKDKGEGEVKVIKTEHKPDDISSYLKDIPKGEEDKPVVMHMHFTRQDFLEHDINSQKNKILSENPNLRIFFAYEFMDREVAMERAVIAGLEEKQLAEEEEAAAAAAKTETNSNKTKKSK